MAENRIKQSENKNCYCCRASHELFSNYLLFDNYDYKMYYRLLRERLTDSRVRFN